MQRSPYSPTRPLVMRPSGLFSCAQELPSFTTRSATLCAPTPPPPCTGVEEFLFAGVQPWADARRGRVEAPLTDPVEADLRHWAVRGRFGVHPSAAQAEADSGCGILALTRPRVAHQPSRLPSWAMVWAMVFFSTIGILDHRTPHPMDGWVPTGPTSARPLAWRAGFRFFLPARQPPPAPDNAATSRALRRAGGRPSTTFTIAALASWSNRPAGAPQHRRGGGTSWRSRAAVNGHEAGLREADRLGKVILLLKESLGPAVPNRRAPGSKSWLTLVEATGRGVSEMARASAVVGINQPSSSEATRRT